MTNDKTLSLEMLSNDVSLNEDTPEDDDIIFASQTQRSDKLKPIMKFEPTKGRARITHSEKSFQLFSPFSMAVIQKRNHANPEVSKNTQEDIFHSNLNLVQDLKEFNLIHSSHEQIPLRKNKSVELDIKTDKTQLVDTLFMNKLSSDTFITESNEKIKEIDCSFLPPNDTFFCNLNLKHQFNENECNTSQVLFANDNGLSSITLDSASYQDECLTSGIILCTQHQKCNASSKLTSKTDYTLPKFKISKKNNVVNYCECESERFKESCLNTESKTLHFNLSVSCLVVKCINTNKLKKKSILSVNEYLESPNSYWKLGNTAKLRKSCSKDSIKTSMKRCHGECDYFLKRKGASYDIEDTSNFPKARHECLNYFQSDVESGCGEIRWTNQYMLEAKLDELLQQSFCESTENREAESWEQGKNFLKHTTKIDEDSDLFFPGRLIEGNDVNTSAPMKSLLETSISRRNSANEEKVAVIESVFRPKEKFEDTKSENSFTRIVSKQSEVIKCSTSEAKKTKKVIKKHLENGILRLKENDSAVNKFDATRSTGENTVT